MKLPCLDCVTKRAEYFKSALSSMKIYGGYAEMGRGAARFLLQKPSDAMRKLRWKAMHAHTKISQNILDFDAFKLIVDAKDEGISAELAIDHMHEPFGTAILRHLLADDMTVVELGANIGYYTMQECSARKLKRVVAIEPNPQSFEILKQNVDLNHCHNVTLHNIAISDSNSTLPFYISKHSNICSITPRTDYERVIDVPVQTLDQLVKTENIDKVDMIRMDIEGHEICALRGMTETLNRDKPWICMEYHAPMISDDEREFFVSTLEQSGYELKCFTFRWSDYPIFGRNIVDKSNVIKTGDLRSVLDNIPKQVLLLFLAHKNSNSICPDSAVFQTVGAP